MSRSRYRVAVVAAMVLFLAMPVVGTVSTTSASGWTVPMVADAGVEGSNPDLEFGVHPGATDGYDSGLDLPHPPPYPSAPFEAHFTITHSLFPSLNRDFRGGTVEQWTLKLRSTAETIELSWNTDSVPIRVSLRMINAESDIDMKVTGNTVLPAGSHTLTIIASQTGPVVYELSIVGAAGGGIAAPGHGQFTYAAGTVVDLVATPDTGFRFVNWTGDVDSIADVNAAQTTIVMDRDSAVTANFAATSEPVGPALIGGIVAAVTVSGLLLLLLLRRRGRST